MPEVFGLGLGIAIGILPGVIGIIAFFGWRKSPKKWQRVVAWISGIWVLLSICLVLSMILSAVSQY